MARINDYTERTTLTGAEELVGVDGIDTFKFTPETLREYDRSKILTGSITKTLAPTGGDFSTLQEVFQWIKDNNFTEAHIRINVLSGTYAVTNVDGTLSVPFGKNILSLEIFGENKTTCIFQYSTNTSYTTFIEFNDCNYVHLYNITIQSITTGTRRDTGLTFSNSTYGFVDDCIINGFYYGIFALRDAQGGVISSTLLGRVGAPTTLIWVASGAVFDIQDTTLDNVDNQGSGIYLSSEPTTLATVTSTVTIQNCNYGMQILGGVKIISNREFSNIIFNNNNFNTNVPLNEMQFNGGFIGTKEGIRLPAVMNNQTGIDYTIQDTDNTKVLTFDNANSIAVTLPDDLPTGFSCTVIHVGDGVPTITPNTDTINGSGAGVTPSAKWKELKLFKYSTTAWVAVIN